MTQYAYEPYGLLVAAEQLSAEAPVNRVGHQGFTLSPWSRSLFERFDGQFTDLTITDTNEGLYFNRNRFYSPSLGRFIQPDPNETALPILSALVMNGQAGWEDGTRRVMVSCLTSFGSGSKCSD